MRPTYYKIFLLLISCWHLASAQDTLRLPVIIKWTPSMLLDPDNSLTLGVEIPISRRGSIQQEIGWGHNQFNAHSYEKEQFPTRQTWRLRSQFRLYIPSFSVGRDKFYLAVEYFRKNVLTERYQSVGRLCNPTTGTCVYFEEITIRSNRRVNAFHGKAGYVFFLSSHFILDLYVGAGIRDLVVTDNSGNNLPNNTNRLWDWRTTRPGRYGTMPSISAGFHLGIAFNQKPSP